MSLGCKFKGFLSLCYNDNNLGGVVIDSIYQIKKYKPIVLVILDGWGISPSWGGNAISFTNPANFNYYWRNYAKTILQSFSLLAGRHGKVGNSEIGHASIGSGRMVNQDIVEIDQSIDDKSFFKNPELLEITQFVKKNDSTLHLIGMISDGAVHSHIDHLYALLQLAKSQQVPRVAIHAITDGRDVERTSAINYIIDLEKKIKELDFNTDKGPKARITTIIGRSYAMDRNDNIKLSKYAYELQVHGRGNIYKNSLQAIRDNYRYGVQSDEFITASVINDTDLFDGRINDADAVLCFNFRSDRMRQLARFYRDKNYLKRWGLFRRYPLPQILFATLTDYKLADSLNIKIIFKSAVIENTLARIIANHKMKQLHIAESEKYAHVSYFFNGGVEKIFPGEERIIIPSKYGKNQRLDPAMQAQKITQAIINAIKSPKYHFILANYANVDMIGHSGDFSATSQAVEIVDKQLKLIVDEGLKNNAAVIITADHGNAEQILSVESVDHDTRHTISPVPFILITKDNQKNLLKSAISEKIFLESILSSSHCLADVAPTILDLMHIAKPTDMTGKSLLNELE